MASDHTVDKGLEMNRMARASAGFQLWVLEVLVLVMRRIWFGTFFIDFLFCDKTLFPRLRLMDFETFHGAGKFVQINSCLNWKFCECRLTFNHL